MEELRLDLVLHHARPAHLHGPLVGRGGDPGRGAHLLDLGPALVQAHVVQEVVQGHELVGACTPARPVARISRTQLITRVELRVAPMV
jgi:hypothetical protein